MAAPHPAHDRSPVFEIRDNAIYGHEVADWAASHDHTIDDR